MFFSNNLTLHFSSWRQPAWRASPLCPGRCESQCPRSNFQRASWCLHWVPGCIWQVLEYGNLSYLSSCDLSFRPWEKWMGHSYSQEFLCVYKKSTQVFWWGHLCVDFICSTRFCIYNWLHSDGTYSFCYITITFCIIASSLSVGAIGILLFLVLTSLFNLH